MFWDPILANIFTYNFPCFLLTCTSTILILISILVFFFMFMFPLLGDKQRFKFRGVISIKYTHFILMLLCYSCSF